MSSRHLKITTCLGLGFGLIALLPILVIALRLNGMQQIQNRMWRDALPLQLKLLHPAAQH